MICDLVRFGDPCVGLILLGGIVVPEFGQVEKLVGDYRLEMGGSCAFFAGQAAKLGMKAAILGKVGRDAFGESILARLAGAGVATCFVKVDPGPKAGIGVALCKENDRAILIYPGTITALQPAETTDQLLASAQHWHHGSQFLHSQLRPPARPEPLARHQLGPG